MRIFKSKLTSGGFSHLETLVVAVVVIVVVAVGLLVYRHDTAHAGSLAVIGSGYAGVSASYCAVNESNPSVGQFKAVTLYFYNNSDRSQGVQIYKYQNSLSFGAPVLNENVYAVATHTAGDIMNISLGSHQSAHSKVFWIANWPGRQMWFQVLLAGHATTGRNFYTYANLRAGSC